ncbi:uncharacterized protein TNCV_1537811 [Trichonephila clavipes]|nr:uncharacterized protein TNCV_1537811 [Trichonephila clavipes]
MPLRKLSVRALQMNVKRWHKENSEREVIKSSNVQNVRLEKLNTVVKKDTSAVGNYILVYFNQVNNLLRSAKGQYCEKQTLKLELGAKLGFSYNLKLLCSNCDENKTAVNTSLKSGPTSHDVNLRITQAFSHIGKGYWNTKCKLSFAFCVPKCPKEIFVNKRRVTWAVTEAVCE